MARRLSKERARERRAGAQCHDHDTIARGDMRAGDEHGLHQADSIIALGNAGEIRTSLPARGVGVVGGLVTAEALSSGQCLEERKAVGSIATLEGWHPLAERTVGGECTLGHGQRGDDLGFLASGGRLEQLEGGRAHALGLGELGERGDKDGVDARGL